MTFQATEVAATFTPDGWPLPSALTWDGTTLSIVDTGRRWRCDDGVHLLVRVADGRVFELHTNGARWRGRLVSQPPQHA